MLVILAGAAATATAQLLLMPPGATCGSDSASGAVGKQPVQDSPGEADLQLAPLPWRMRAQSRAPTDWSGQELLEQEQPVLAVSVPHSALAAQLAARETIPASIALSCQR